MADLDDMLASANRQLGFEGSLQPGSAPALLIIDFAKAYMDRGSPLYADVEDTRAACIELLAACRAALLPVIHTQTVFQPGGRDGGIFYRKVPALRCFEANFHPRWTQFADGLEPQDGETVVTKQYASAFFGTSLASTLTALKIDTLLIAGLTTSGCVRATAVDCCQHGFIPLVIREAVGDRASGSHESNLFDLQTKYAEVVTLERAKTYLGQLPSNFMTEPLA